ncbi:MAG: UvrD-helicase domain-containing protein [Clostridiales bacterium]|nr:UvrD-helicase domain-containing protein [Clostridiales bacterium]
MKFSENQLKAIKTRNKNILVSASAGSGKTAVLTGRVADIVKQPENSIENLLVVTFTRAAAAEMSERIELKIRELLADPNEKNKVHLRKQLRLLNTAEITTIDAFCGRLVRKFFYKTDIDPNFTAAPESRLNDIKQAAMDRVIADAFEKADAGEPLYAPFYDLCDMVSGNGTDTLELEGEIFGIYSALSSLPYPNKWLEETAAGRNAGSYEDYLKLPVCKTVLEGMGLKRAAELIDEADDILTDVFGSDILCGERFQIEAIAEEDDLGRLAERLKDIEFKTFRNSKRKLDPEKSDEAKSLRDAAKKIILEARANSRFFTEKGYKIYKNHLPSLMLFYVLTADFMDEYYIMKSEKNMYEFSDIERICLNMLVDSDGKPTETAIYLRKKYTEILTDEYQDTNPLQEEILKAISRENNRFMVGDIKQSIYGFRNADPTIFAGKYNSFSKETDSENELIRLNENYRSVPEILEFVNEVFSKIMGCELGGAEYEPLNFPESSELSKIERRKIQISILNRTAKLPVEELLEGREAESSEEAAVSAEAPEPEEAAENIFVSENRPDESADSEDAVDKEAEFLRETAGSSSAAEALLIAGKIKELMEEDETIGYGDIVILLSRLKGVADSYIEILEKCGIPAVTDKPADSTNFIENKTIISLLKVIDNPFSDIDLVTVLHSPIYRLTTEELGLIKLSCEERSMSFYDITKNYAESHSDVISEKLSKFFKQREHFAKRFKTEPVNAVLSEIYTETDYYNYLNLLNDNKKRRANLDKLLDLGAEYDQTSQGGLYGFLRCIDSVTDGGEFIQAQVLTPKTDAVRIMTIHGSKGLQFPVVFLSKIKGRFQKVNKGSKIIFDKHMGICMAAFDPKERIVYETAASKAAEIRNNRDMIAEDMRLYYVAMTRAEKRLFITASDTVSGKKPESYAEILQILIDRYENPLKVYSDKITPEAVYSADSFLPILMTALNRSKSSVFNVEYLHWYQLKGITADIKKEIFNRELETTELRRVKYPYTSCVMLPTNISVTEIKRQANEENESEYLKDYAQTPFIFQKPKFLKKNADSITPTEIGTAYHTLISSLDYKNLPEDAEKFKQAAVKRGLITEQEAETVKSEKLEAYIKSPVAKRAGKALYVKKEHSFTMGLAAKDVYPDLDDTAGSEIILTHGIIDMFFEEPDGIVIVDFKTDKTKDDEKLKKTYFPQLSVYKTAVEEATGKKVKELLLCLINRETVLSLP